MTRDEIKKAIHEDYQRVLGNIIFPQEVDGYVGDDSVVVHAAGLHPFEVLPTPDSDLERHMGEGDWDPCWDVKPLYPEEFQSFARSELKRDEDLRSMWVYGHSYREGHGPLERARMRFSDSFVLGHPINPT